MIFLYIWFKRGKCPVTQNTALGCAAEQFVTSETHLKHGQQSYRKRVEVRRWRSFLEVELSAEQLHAEQCKYQYEQEQQEKQRYDWSHGVE